MKVKQIRLVKGCYALGGADNVMATDKISIDMIGGGNFLVDLGPKLVFLPNSQVHFAICEHDAKKAK